MALRDLLLVVDDSKHCDQRIEVAVNLARTHDAHLTGLYITTPPQIPPAVAAEISSQASELVLGELRKAAAQAAALFTQKAAGGQVRTEWRELHGEAAEIILLNARYTDLVIAGQPDPSGDDYGTRADVVTELVLGAARPVLLVPYAGAPAASGRRVLIAWNESREATRAVHAALPLLAKAAQVTVLSVNPEETPSGAAYPGAALVRHLGRHGIQAEAKHIPMHAGGVGRTILERAATGNADLIVMGAWGHSRFRELVLGGATREVLRHMNIPVLIFH